MSGNEGAVPTGRQRPWLRVSLIVMLVLGIAAYWVLHEPDAEPSAHAVLLAKRVQGVARSRRAASVIPPTESPTAIETAATDGPLPPPVDLSHVDRDLDLHGVVVRADGTPIAGASAETFTQPWRDLDSMNYEGFEERVAGPSSRTATDGTFSLRLRRGEAVTLVVRAVGLRRVELPSRRAGERVRVVLDEGVTLRVRAHTPDGAVAGGVPIRVVRGSGQDVNFAMEASTDAEGRCSFAGLPPGLSAYVTGPRGASPVVTLLRVALPASGTVDADVVVTAAKRLTGRIVGADGGPIADAEAALGEDFQRPVTAGADGRFVLAGWDGASTDEVHARAPGYAQRGVAAGNGEVELRLTPAASARGRIVDAARAPVAGALVSLVAGTTQGERPWPFSAGHAVSASDGTFEITGLDASLAHVVVAGRVGVGRLLAPVTLQPGTATTDLGDITLAAPRIVAGRVIAGADAPVTRCVVWMVPWSDDPARPMLRPRGTGQRETATDDMGRFAFADAGPGTYRVIVRPTGLAECWAPVSVAPEANPEPLVVKIAVSSELVVHVVDGAGAPVGGIWVMATSSKGGPCNATTAADGTAKLGLQSDGAKIRVIPSEASGRRFVTPPPTPVEALQTQMTIVLQEGNVVAGSLLDADGKPIGRAQISVRQLGRAPVTVVGGTDGKFRTLVGSAAPVEVAFDGIVTQPNGHGGEMDDDCGLRGSVANVAPGSEDVVVRCSRRAPGAGVVFRALRPDGSPFAGAPISYARKDTGVGGFKKTGVDGTLRIEDLAPATWVAAGTYSGDLCPPAWVEFVPAGQEVVLRWRATESIEGVAAFDDGTSPGKADCRVEDRSGWNVSNDLRDGGAFRVPVPAGEGPWKVIVRGRDSKGEFEGVLESVSSPADGVRVRLARK